MLLCSMRKYGLTTKFTKDTRRGSDISNSELRDFRVLRGEHLLAYLVAAQPRWDLRGEDFVYANFAVAIIASFPALSIAQSFASRPSLDGAPAMGNLPPLS